MTAERWHFRERLELGPWAAFANCKDAEPDLFFPTRGVLATDQAEARAICAACPVREDCLEWALANNEVFGLWGGLTPRERRRLRRARRLGRSAA